MEDPKVYGIIIEHKAEGPLMMESKPLTYAQASERLREFVKRPDIIRVAMFSITYATGNETLIEKEPTL